MLREIADRLKEEHHVTLEFTDAAVRFLARAGYDPQYGARELRRAVEKHVQMPLSRMILSGGLKKNSQWRVSVEDEALAFLSMA